MSDKEKRKNIFLAVALAPCAYCGVMISFDNATIDHKTPKALGGNNAHTNLVISCRKCNTIKGAKPFEVWILEIGQKIEKWTFPAPRKKSKTPVSKPDREKILASQLVLREKVREQLRKSKMEQHG